MDSSLVDSPRQLHGRIRRLFRLAKQAVDLELGSSQPVERQVIDQDKPRRPATGSQIRAIQAIAGRLQLDPEKELRELFGLARPKELSFNEANQLIEATNSSANGATRPSCATSPANSPSVLFPHGDGAGGV